MVYAIVLCGNDDGGGVCDGSGGDGEGAMLR